MKLARGRQHRQVVYQAIEDFRLRQTYTFKPEIESGTGQQVWRVHGQPGDPGDIAVLIGDCVYNFRSALDHLAWQLVIASSGKPDTTTMFPIFNDAERFLSGGFRRLKGMSADAIASVVMWQPCYGRNPHRNRMLCALERVMNIDKHRHLNVVVASSDGAFWKPGSAMGAEVLTHQGAIDNGTVLARFPAGDVKDVFAPVIGIAFGEEEMPYGGAVMQLLMGIDATVCHVVEDFRAKFFSSEPPFPQP